jgi:3-oxoacyl-[acyl-carrier-protein] synthase-3
MRFKITGSGSYVPKLTKVNDDFLDSEFFDKNGSSFENSNSEIIDKFVSITGIQQRKYASEKLNSSDLATRAANNAISDSNIDPETLDYIIFAHNFGDISSNSKQIDNLPALATKVKRNLKIKNPKCIGYDIIFGCPGWVEGVIQAKSFIQSNMASKCLIIGSETLSRVTDLNDRDSMIYADGAGAVILEGENSDSGGVLSHSSASYTSEGENEFIFYGLGNKLDSDEGSNNNKYLKMHGRKVYEFALKNVPAAMKDCFDKAKKDISSLKKIFIHQANQKMDEAIINRFYRLYKTSPPDDILPMNIQEYGNSSVACIPTLFDIVRKENYKGHKISKGDVIMFASVGAGMNVNAITYEV